MAEREQRNNSISHRILSGIYAAILLLLMYCLSAGPVFALCKYRMDDPYGVCRYYLPLIRIAPLTMSNYLNWWGVSDIEAFFILSIPECGGFGSIPNSGLLRDTAPTAVVLGSYLRSIDGQKANCQPLDGDFLPALGLGYSGPGGFLLVQLYFNAQALL